jgi:hypothetical protein
LVLNIPKTFKNTLQKKIGQILINFFIYLFVYMHVYECYVVIFFSFFSLHTFIKGFPFVTSEFYFSFSILGVICLSHCRIWIAFMYIHLMDKDVHSFHAIEMALITTSPFVETIFFLSMVVIFQLTPQFVIKHNCKKNKFGRLKQTK